MRQFFLEISLSILSGIIKTDLSDHLPVFVVDSNINANNCPEKITKKKRFVHNNLIMH